MKNLQIAFASALLIFSANSFAATCDPCTAKERVAQDSVLMSQEQLSHDENINAILQRMTTVAHFQVTSTQSIVSKSHKRDKKNHTVKP